MSKDHPMTFDERIDFALNNSLANVRNINDLLAVSRAKCGDAEVARQEASIEASRATTPGAKLQALSQQMYWEGVRNEAEWQLAAYIKLGMIDR